VAVRRRAVTCWRSARFSSAIAWYPQQISPIERRSTISAVSMRDSLVDQRINRRDRRSGFWRGTVCSTHADGTCEVATC